MFGAFQIPSNVIFEESFYKLIPTEQTMKEEQTNYVNHSGGAVGADSVWGDIGKEYGVTSNHYYHGERSQFNAPGGNTEITEADYNEGRFKAAQAAKRNYGYQYSAMKDDRLIRNWNQVKYADAIFAIGSIVERGEKVFPSRRDDTRIATNPTVTGGTGYAVGMAILEGKPVHVFDQNKNQWYTWDGNNFVVENTPTLTQNFAGIGTREINESGKNAIREVYEKTFNKPNMTQTTTGNVLTGLDLVSAYDRADKRLRSELSELGLSDEELNSHFREFSTILRNNNINTEDAIFEALRKYICNL